MKKKPGIYKQVPINKSEEVVGCQLPKSMQGLLDTLTQQFNQPSIEHPDDISRLRYVWQAGELELVLRYVWHDAFEACKEVAAIFISGDDWQIVSFIPLMEELS